MRTTGLLPACSYADNRVAVPASSSQIEELVVRASIAAPVARDSYAATRPYADAAQGPRRLTYAAGYGPESIRVQPKPNLAAPAVSTWDGVRAADGRGDNCQVERHRNRNVRVLPLPVRAVLRIACVDLGGRVAASSVPGVQQPAAARRRPPARGLARGRGAQR